MSDEYFEGYDLQNKIVSHIPNILNIHSNCLSFCIWMTMSRRWIYVKLSINISGHTQWVGLGILMMIIIIKKNGTCYRGFFIQNMIWMKPKERFSQHSSIHFLRHSLMTYSLNLPRDIIEYIRFDGELLLLTFLCVFIRVYRTQFR